MSKKIVLMLAAAILLVVLSACQPTAPSFAEIPAGKAFANGEIIYFTHTEVSDKAVSELLTNMMKSPVIFVPALAQAPDAILSNVYVFKNGIAGSGPLNFQADVFENTPDDAGYSPLRRITFVTWKNESQAKELKSIAEIQGLAGTDAVILEKSGVVVNMPFITWKGGKR